MANLKQKIGLMNYHNSSPSISSEVSTPRSNLASISQALDRIQGLRQTNDNQANLQIEQEIGAGNIDSNSGEGGKNSRAESGCWDQVMNSQSTDFLMEDMDIDMDSKILCAFCPHPQDKALCITVHSLGGPLSFKYQGMIRIPCDDTFVSRRQGIYGVQMMHLVSLQPIGGALRKSVAGAFDRNVFVCDLSSVSANLSAVASPKALWQAHASLFSCMHQSSFVCALITGASDGCICLWDMKTKPTYPIGQYLHRKQVTSTEMLDGTTICSGGIDGTLQLWDIRCGTTPFM